MLTLQYLKKLKFEKQYRENQVLYNLISTIIGECEQIAKDPTTSQILAVIGKLYKDNAETIEKCKKSQSALSSTEELEAENEFMKTFLPQQLTKEELIAIIGSQMSLGLKLPDIMKYLTQNYKGRYDGKQAVSIINSLQ